ncbi:MAG: penicillin-binding protein 2, partial [Clostridia bacterium]|nr:penicillin-binding protein 2 [Clostridia bacterium]
ADEAEPLYNRALQGVYAPGSTYKIGVALAALEGGYIDSSDTYFCNKLYYSNGSATGHTCLGTHGRLNVVEAIRESCNVFFYNLGELMGIEEITRYTYELGLGADTGLELGNKSGIVAGPAYRENIGGSSWLLGDDLNASIGQSDHGYTPLQMSVYISSVVNGGTRYKVSLLDSVRVFHTDDIIYKTETEPLAVLSDDEYSDETEELLKEAMRQVISEGSGTLQSYFDGVPVTVGGKTGTAEVAGKKDYAVFCGFAPLDTPEIVISCVIEEGVYGYRAAYTVGKVMEKYFEE